jgi:Glycosyl hydrolase catalytic core
VTHAQIVAAIFAAMRLRLITSVLTAALALALVPAAATASVPQGFVGMMVDGPYFYPSFDQAGQLDKMVASGVESIRTVFNWEVMQPLPNEASVPASQRGLFTDVNGVPTNFTVTDQLVALAAARRLTVLPVVEYAPTWDSLHPGKSSSPPKTPGPFAKFVVALVQRYGPRGSFWAAHPNLPRVPIRMFQIWNEPDFTVYWSQQPFEAGYVRLLKATHIAVKKADRGAKIIAAGLPNFSWDYLAKMYKLGAKPYFDGVALHPYTATPQGVITIIGKARAVMNRNGDRRKPIYATEVSWPSAKGKARTTFENATSEAGQAKNVAAAVRMLAANRKRLGIAALYHYTWVSNETPSTAGIDQFNFAGLFRFINGRGLFVKPALATFTKAALAIEGCRSKGPLATNCAK